MRTKNLFDPTSKEPFPLSRTKLELFFECPRCFYLDRRRGIERPPQFPFTLNAAVDALLKKEFDAYRKTASAHTLMKDFGVEAIPYDHPHLADWRNNFKGIRFLHKETNLEIFGAVDDVWVRPDGRLIIVDYKSTSTTEEITLNESYKEVFKRQVEIYQWLFRQNGFKVDDISYFVYCNALKDREMFDKKLEFATMLISYQGRDAWVEQVIYDAHRCLTSDQLPEANPECKYCNYRKVAGEVEENS